ncbi:hypothetical protein H4P2_00002 (plasmid) [Variovorax sp. PBS-H4]|nr:hypothetical protein CHC06_08132 [Variovorax sp. B2]PNG45907.1 hypothetical protein CHC07_08133 [Variovorax sp. B4]VTU41684.1 hypothetical protein H4P2_00002 [Variovorax sp. PBS-H4]VTV19340.1 hypothetical protein WDL1P4_00002 [Variovorax sp. WDL1]
MKRRGTSSDRRNGGNLVSTQLSAANLRACGNQVSAMSLVGAAGAQLFRLASDQNMRCASIPEPCVARKLEEFCGNQVAIQGSAVVEEIEGRRSARRPSAGAAFTGPAGSRQRAASAGSGNQVSTSGLEAARNATITHLTSNRLRGETSNPRASVRRNCAGGGCGNQVSTSEPTAHSRGQGRSPCPTSTKGRAPVLATWNSGNLVSSEVSQVGGSSREFHTDQMSAFCRLWTPHYGTERGPVLRAEIRRGHSESVSRLYKEA